jgi:hypothetical protein
MENDKENIYEVKLSGLDNLEAYANNKIIFKGLVIKADRRKSKTGKEFCLVEIEDETDSYTLYLFGKDYKGFNPIIEEGIYLRVESEVKKTFNRIGLMPIAMNNKHYEIRLTDTDNKIYKINNMEYSEDFKEFVNKGVEENYFIGTGFPNAKILMVGKESAISPEDIEKQKWYSNNAENWLQHINNNSCETLEYPVKKDTYLYNSWGKNTWSKYQQLSDLTWNIKTKKYYINFLKYFFTTEINDSPAKNTSIAKKEMLNERKSLFKHSQFIQSFPVIILACSDYIKNNDKIREIDDIFGVKYDGDENGKYWYSKGNWFYTHHNADNSKLVVHTRQLSANVKNELLQDMAKVISEHLNYKCICL